MPDSAIVISATDNYSTAMAKMSSVTKEFSKDVDELEQQLYSLNKNKYALKLDAANALAELKRLERQSAAAGDEADGLKVELAQANYDGVKRNLDLVTRGASETERQMQKTGDAFRKAGNAESGALSSLSAFGKGIAQAAQGAAINIANSLVKSAGGDQISTLFSNALTTGISGASAGFTIGSSIGSIGGSWGAAIGAAVGSGIGLINGATENFSKRDNAFKSYVQEQYNAVTGEQASILSNGSATAGKRETALISFSALLGSDSEASVFLDSIKTLANTTSFPYDDLTGLSKALLTHGYDSNAMIPALTGLGGASAALGLEQSDVATVAAALGSMSSMDKASQKYLDLLTERGIEAVDWLAERDNISTGAVYDRVSKGTYSGKETAAFLLEKMNELYGEAVERQSQTFEGLSSILQSRQGELANAAGEGYNAVRKGGIQDEIDWLSGEDGQSMQEAYSAIGAWKADLENKKEEFQRTAIEAMMRTEDYQNAKAAGNAAEMGRLIMEAKVQGINEYNASTGAQQALESELALAGAIRDDTKTNTAFWSAGFLKAQEFTKGLMEGFFSGNIDPTTGNRIYEGYAIDEYSNFHPDQGYAYGLKRVPRDNFPALLHEGERVLTADQARTMDRQAGTVVVDKLADTLVIREESDIEKIAAALARKLQRSSGLAVPV
ncbi:MAG: hypothetical protein VB085_12315 [Peptococcaceae bacterium]|nr:hypothetical protein [Peptococcaceae bacterium]